ncbi:diacylglycerol/lipid kinase family protein [Anaerococcus provencensis]|uniref:diacylglycerol/lipid kinase family protein n=1 Tax=Anaerococcus provencensis TaxID=938293 RepID=UPI0002DE2BC2|nr:diacylglycerol kinase family protein [Anaerococcus provencensis]
MKNALFIYNPNSGQKTINDQLSWIIDYLSEKEYLTSVYATQAPRDASKIISKYGENFQEIIVAGGDGTLDEAIAAISKAEIDPLISYIPTGSTNDFSKSLEIPTDIEKAVKLASRGDQKRIDIGQIDDKYFVYVAAFGSISDVSFNTDQDAKNIFGRSAYIIEGLKQALPLTNMTSYKMDVLVDDENINGDFIHFMVTNSVSVGGFTGITGDNVSLSDGIFELTMVRRPQSLADVNKIVSGLTNREENDMLIFRQGSHFEVKTNQKVSWSLDGEYGGTSTFAKIDALKEKVRMRTGIRDNQ